ncbi:hypothetical protein KEM56_003058 [Ascosphaera pollenicola]|nr:hypothetical protein KEM56_003058 [Ascosphaera pollenicola]
MPQSTPAPTTGRSAVLHEITTEPTSQAMTTSIDQPRSANPWGPTPVGFFVVPSLFQKDLERLAVNDHRQQKAGPDTDRAEMTAGTTDVRVLIKNLEICARHLGPHEPVSRSGETIDVMLSCKEALSSLFRWRQSQEIVDRMANLRSSDSRIAPSDPQNVQLNPKIHGSHKLLRRGHGTGENEELPSHEDTEQGASIAKAKSAKSVKTIISSAEQTQITEKLSKSTKRCQSTVCEPSKLKKRCQKPWDLGQTGFDRLCKICFPRNEALIHTHCLNQARKEKAAFFFLAAALLLSVVILVTVVFVKDRRRKRKARMSNEHGANANSSRSKPATSSGLQSLIQCKESFANWRGPFQRMGNWTAVQKLRSWMSREKPSSDVENARESSCDSFKPEEMLMSPFDYAPGTGRFFSSDHTSAIESAHPSTLCQNFQRRPGRQRKVGRRIESEPKIVLVSYGKYETKVESASL